MRPPSILCSTEYIFFSNSDEVLFALLAEMATTSSKNFGWGISDVTVMPLLSEKIVKFYVIKCQLHDVMLIIACISIWHL